MRFDVFNWASVDTGAGHESSRGRLYLRAATDKMAVFVECEGYEALAGYGWQVDVTLSCPFRWRVEVPDGVEVYIFSPRIEVLEPTGEVFTNIDRKPSESGAVLEVSKALRVFKLEQAHALREIRQERESLDVARSRRVAAEAASLSDPVPADPDPVPADPVPADPRKAVSNDAS